MGLFDSVSSFHDDPSVPPELDTAKAKKAASHFFKGNSEFQNDVAELHLTLDDPTLGQVVQLRAANEYRLNFAATDIASAGGKGCEVVLPGAHSDVGGGCTQPTEEIREYIGRPEAAAVAVAGFGPGREGGGVIDAVAEPCVAVGVVGGRNGQDIDEQQGGGEEKGSHKGEISRYISLAAASKRGGTGPPARGQKARLLTPWLVLRLRTFAAHQPGPWMLKRIVFFWLTSFGAATAGYYLLWLLLPEHRVFGALYRMLLYHDAHPLAFIALACLCHGPLAAGAGRAFSRRGQSGRVMITLTVIALTIGISSPLGGMLWHWYDMRAGYFPADWGRILLVQGSLDGCTTGWLVMLLSIPYSWLGLPVCYYLLQTGNRLFPPRSPALAPLTQGAAGKENCR